MKLWEEDFVGEMCYLVISFPIWPLSDQSSLDKPVVGESWSDANFCLSYLLTMVYLRYTRSGHLDIVAISWRAHSNSLIFATFFCHIPTYFISHTNAHTVSRVYFSLCPRFLAAAQYSSQGSGSETLRVSLRVSGSGSEGRVRAKHHNTRDNGGFMPFASYGLRLRPDGETDKEKLCGRTSSPREDMKRFQIVRLRFCWLYSHCEPLVSLLSLFSVSLYCHFVCPGQHMSAEPKWCFSNWSKSDTNIFLHRTTNWLRGCVSSKRIHLLFGIFAQNRPKNRPNIRKTSFWFSRHVPRPGPRSITISDVTRMQMWKQRREHHRQHCHNHGILSYNYNHQKYTRQLDIWYTSRIQPSFWLPQELKAWQSLSVRPCHKSSFKHFLV